MFCLVSLAGARSCQLLELMELLSSEQPRKPSIALLPCRSSSHCRSLVCWTIGIQAGNFISCLLADYIYTPVALARLLNCG